MNTETTITSSLTGNAAPTHVPPIPKTFNKFPGQDLIPKITDTRSTTVGINSGSTFEGMTTPSNQTFYLQTIPTSNIYNDPNGNSGTVSYFTPVAMPVPLPLKLYAKIHKIIQDGIRVGKNGRNDFHKYDYVTEADVVDEMKRIFTENNMVYDFNIIGTRKIEGLENVTEVEAEITLIDLSSGESKVYSFFGQGQDKGDKGIYKAYTGLQKYFFMKNFLISTGDDPENDSGKANQAVAKTATTTKKTGFVAPTRTPSTGPTVITFQKTTVAADPELLNKDISNGTISKDNLTKVAEAVNTLPVSGSVTFQEAPQQATAVNAAPTETAPVVKKPRGTFNPPKRVVKTEKKDE